MEIRLATPADDAALARLFAAYHDEYRHELGEQDVTAEGRCARQQYGGNVLVADGAGPDGIVGCVAYQPWGEGRARMRRMFVPVPHRGRGIGRALAIAVMDLARADGFRQMVLDTTGPMQAATGLYRSLGFTEFEPDYDAPCRGTVYLACTL